MRILVVDDDVLTGEIVSVVLESYGHEVILAENGVEAVEKLNSYSDIGLIISDMNMPMISGIDLFRELKEQGSAIPFILLTGDEPSAFLSQEPRIDACIVKDFNLKDSLVDAIDKVMAKYGLIPE